jgi:precorrin-3B synthase
MNALGKPQPRGACPGLSAPMPTGDGLLVRFLPIGTISLAAMSGLCATARKHGNGIIEITSRGSIQLRGLSPHSAPQCADDIAALAIAADDGVPIHCSPLAGIDAAELFDANTVVAQLRSAIAQQSLTMHLSPKVSVVIDGGGALGLAALAADIRLRAQMTDGQFVFRVGIGGDDESATELGSVRLADGVEAVLRLLNVIARRGRTARARNIVASEGAAAFHAALFSCPALCRASTIDVQRNADAAIGSKYRLKDGSLAYGVELAFGFSDAASLEKLVDAAAAAGAQGLRIAPSRSLLVIGLAPETVDQFVDKAERLGFITCADDPRRRVIACAGAPICAYGHIASRELAPQIADQIAQAKLTVHLSGCAKGCARAASADLTIVGTPDGCALIAGGTTRDTPFAVVSTNALPKAITDYTGSRVREAAHV